MFSDMTEKSSAVTAKRKRTEGRRLFPSGDDEGFPLTRRHFVNNYSIIYGEMRRTQTVSSQASDLSSRDSCTNVLESPL